MKQKKKKVIYDHFSSAGVRQRHDPQTMMQSGQKKNIVLELFFTGVRQRHVPQNYDEKKKLIYNHFSSTGARQRHVPQTIMQSGQKKILFLNIFYRR